MWTLKKKKSHASAKIDIPESQKSVTLFFHRSRSFRGHLRDIRLYVDNEPVISIANEENIMYKCSPGMHTVYARLDSLRSQVINFKAAENAKYCFEVVLTMNEGLCFEMKPSHQ